MFITAFLGLAAVLLAIQGIRKLRRSRSPAHPPLPPGPTPILFLGNVLGLNRRAPHLTYTAWSKKYGTSLLCTDATDVRPSNRGYHLHPRLGPGRHRVELGRGSHRVARKALEKVL